jgi:hypothetical protein
VSSFGFESDPVFAVSRVESMVFGFENSAPIGMLTGSNTPPGSPLSAFYGQISPFTRCGGHSRAKSGA